MCIQESALKYRTLFRSAVLATACVIFSSGAMAQTLQSIPFRANLSTANEVPPLDLAATGSATVWIHAVRNSSGVVTEAVVDFIVDYSFPGPITITGLHVHRGIRGQNGPVVLSSGVGSGEAEDSTGKAGITRQSAKLDSAAAISAINDMIADPSNFYVNLHTTVNPGGVIRGQALATTATTVLTQLSPANEVPAIEGSTASGFAAVTTLVGRDIAGVVTSAEATFDVQYTGFPADTQFTGLHVHTGGAGVNGPVTINSSLSGAVPAAGSGSGSLRLINRMSAPNAATIAALAGLETNPGGFYINLHTRVNPGGVIRGQAVAVDASQFGVNVSSNNEVPPVDGLNATGTANFILRPLRGTDGVPLAALATFDVYHRFPAGVTVTGLHVHSGVLGQNAPVVINSGISANDSPVSATGLGNVYRTALITNGAVLAAALQNPAGHYLNLHTTDNPGGAIRSQLVPATTALPVIDRVEAVAGGGTVRSDGLIRIVGSNLAASTASSSNAAGIAVPSLVGTAVKVGGQEALIRTVTPTAVVVQIPRNVGLGIMPVATFPVIVTTANGSSNVANLVLTVSGN